MTAPGSLSAAGGPAASRPVLRLGVSLSVTGPAAPSGIPILRGVELALEDVNRAGGAGGHALEAVVLDGAGPGGQDQHVRASYERFVADPLVIAVVGPQTSRAGRAVAALLSHAGLATVTPSSTTFDLTDAALRATYRPGGRTVYFRTIGTDVTQGDAMARFAHASLGARRILVIEDGLPFAVRVTDAFARQAAALGLTVVGRRQVNWLRGDYRDELRALKALEPDTVYVGARYQVGVKLARQIPGVMPAVRVLGPDTLYDRAFPVQARPTGAEGWYVSNVAPDPAASTEARAWAERFGSRFGIPPSGYSLTGYAAVAVVADAVERVAKQGRPLSRARVRDAIALTRLPHTPAGPVSFDAEGDLEQPAVSIYQVGGGAFHHVETILTARAKVATGAGEARR